MFPGGVTGPPFGQSYYNEGLWPLDSGSLALVNKAAAATVTLQPSLSQQWDTTVGANLHIRSTIMRGGSVLLEPFADAGKSPQGFMELRSDFNCVHYGLNHLNTTVSMMSGFFFGDTMGLVAAVPANPTGFGWGLFSIHNDPGHKWQAWTVNKNTLVWKKTDLVGTQGPTGGFLPRVRVVVNPGASIQFMVNGVLGYTESDANFLPVPGDGFFANEILGFYANSGTNAAARLTCNFHGWRLRVRDKR